MAGRVEVARNHSKYYQQNLEIVADTSYFLPQVLKWLGVGTLAIALDDSIGLMIDLIQDYMQEFWWITILSATIVVGFLISIPVLVVRLPVDYIICLEQQPVRQQGKRTFSRIYLSLIRNVLGLILVLIGIALLVLPGEGIITIIIGLLLIDFPGKIKFKCWLVQQPVVIRSINWVRAKAGRPKLQTPLARQSTNITE